VSEQSVSGNVYFGPVGSTFLGIDGKQAWWATDDSVETNNSIGQMIEPEEPHCFDCGSRSLHEGPNDPPPWCCCEDCGSCNVGTTERAVET